MTQSDMPDEIWAYKVGFGKYFMSEMPDWEATRYVRASLPPDEVAALQKAIKVIGAGYDWDDSTCPSEYRDSMKALLNAAKQLLGMVEK